MRSAILHEALVIAIDHDECLRLMNEEVIGDRINPLASDAKIAVHPLRHIDPAYEPLPLTDFGHSAWGKRLRVARCIAYLGDGFDLKIYVPSELLRDAFIAAEIVTREAVIISASQLEEMCSSLPTGGIEMRFDNGIGLPQREFEELHR